MPSLLKLAGTRITDFSGNYRKISNFNNITQSPIFWLKSAGFVNFQWKQKLLISLEFFFIQWMNFSGAFIIICRVADSPQNHGENLQAPEQVATLQWLTDSYISKISSIIFEFCYFTRKVINISRNVYAQLIFNLFCSFLTKGWHNRTLQYLWKKES